MTDRPMLQGIKIYIAPDARIPLLTARRALWHKKLPALGAQLVSTLIDATHVVLGDEEHNRICKTLAATSEGPCILAVHYNWVSHSLRDGAPQKEADYQPPAMTASLAKADLAKSATTVVARKPSVAIADLQSLILFLCRKGPKPEPFAIQGRMPDTLVILQVHGLPWATRHRLQLPGSCLVELCASQRPEVASQSLSNFVRIAKHPTKRKHNENERLLEKEPNSIDQQPIRSLEWYLATPRQMRIDGYPGFAVSDRNACLAQKGDEQREAAVVFIPPGFMDTRDFPVLTSQHHLVAVDCEMVITERGFELARVTVLDGDTGDTLLDEFVVPDVPVKDYNTRFSGISAETLGGVTTRVRDVWRLLQEFIGPQTIVVGHTLENDLKALRLVHRRCVDTALLFPEPRGPCYRFSLRGLATRYLGRKIQQGEHDSAEDARAALDLICLRMKMGFNVSSGQLFAAILARDDTSRRRSDGLVQRFGMVDRQEVLSMHAPSTTEPLHICGCDEEVVSALTSELATGLSTTTKDSSEQAVFFGALRDLEEFQEEQAVNLSISTPEDAAMAVHAFFQDDNQAKQDQLVDTALAHINKILASLPINSVVVLFCGGENTSLCRALVGELLPMQRNNKHAHAALRSHAQHDKVIKQFLADASRGFAVIFNSSGGRTSLS